MNPVGWAAAGAAFFAIWLGHVSVRKIEFASETLWLPAAGYICLGLIVEALSLFVNAQWACAALGILGITLLWDAVELKRQESRVRRGHAPANPNNPRHTAMRSQSPGSLEERGLIF